MHFDELDLAIPDMDSVAEEERVKAALAALPGIETVRLMERGAFVRHHSETITAQDICGAIRRLGLRASIFQDSAGHLGKSSQ